MSDEEMPGNEPGEGAQPSKEAAPGVSRPYMDPPHVAALCAGALAGLTGLAGWAAWRHPDGLAAVLPWLLLTARFAPLAAWTVLAAVASEAARVLVKQPATRLGSAASAAAVAAAVGLAFPALDMALEGLNGARSAAATGHLLGVASVLAAAGVMWAAAVAVPVLGERRFAKAARFLFSHLGNARAERYRVEMLHIGRLWNTEDRAPVLFDALSGESVGDGDKGLKKRIERLEARGYRVQGKELLTGKLGDQSR